MRVVLPARDLTLDDVAELAAADSARRYELDNGTLVVMPPGDVEHNTTITRLAVWLAMHGYPTTKVLPKVGLRTIERTTGRCPDLVVLRRTIDGQTVWVDPDDVAVVVEIVSRGSEQLDRVIKPAEYARAGIVHFWRIERGAGAASVHMYALGTGEQGEPVYIGHRAMLLDELLSGEPPPLRAGAVGWPQVEEDQR